MYKHLLVTLDGSPRGETVIPHALDIAHSMGARLTLLRIVDEPDANWGERGALGKVNAASVVRSALAEQAATYLERVAAQMKPSGVTVLTLVKHGPSATQILSTAKEIDVDCIAMATRSRRGLNRVMFGSVAEQILYQSSLPVLLVRAA
ncbi:MAG: universal stress protein [Dehalococcoidia bacterium]